MNRDNAIYILIGIIIGLLIAFNLWQFFGREKDPITFTITRLHREFKVDTLPYQIPNGKDTIYVDTTTRVLDLPIRKIEREVWDSIMVNKEVRIRSIKIFSEVQGIQYSLGIEAEPVEITYISKPKLDWKWPAIAFLGGILVSKYVVR